MSVFDFDSGADGEYVEQLRVDSFEYYKPLRPSSGNDVTSSVLVNEEQGRFVSTAHGTPADNPSDPLSLTDVQASRGVQLFFRPSLGYVNASFIVDLDASSG